MAKCLIDSCPQSRVAGNYIPKMYRYQGLYRSGILAVGLGVSGRS